MPPALLPTQRPGVGSIRSGYSSASNRMARVTSSPPSMGRPTTCLATLCSHTHALELGDRRVEKALPRLEPSSFPRRRLDLWRHGLPFVTQILTEVNELSQSEKIS